MEIKIYIDVLLLINLIGNYLLLWLTGLLLHRRISSGRMLAAAGLGALYAVCVFFLPPSPAYGIPVRLAVGALMAALAFRPGCLRACIKYICVFYCAVFIWGGAAFSFFYFSGAAALFGTVYRNGTLYINLPVYLLLLLAAACWLLLRLAFSLGARLSARGKGIIPLRVEYQGKALSLRGFYDSGNLLRDEISGKSVMIAQWESLRPLFPDAKTPEEAFRQEAGFIAIAYRTLQGDALLTAFLPDALYIEKGRRLMQTEAVYIGLIDQTLDYYNNWDAILPHDFEGEKHYEPNLDAKAAGTC